MLVAHSVRQNCIHDSNFMYPNKNSIIASFMVCLNSAVELNHGHPYIAHKLHRNRSKFEKVTCLELPNVQKFTYFDKLMEIWC